MYINSVCCIVSIVDIVVAMNDKVRKRLGAQNYDNNGICALMDTIA